MVNYNFYLYSSLSSSLEQFIVNFMLAILVG